MRYRCLSSVTEFCPKIRATVMMGVLWHCVSLHAIGYLLKWAKLGLSICPNSMNSDILYQRNNMLMQNIGIYYSWPNLAQKCQPQPWGVLWHCGDIHTIGYLLKWTKLGLDMCLPSMRSVLLHQRNNMIMLDILLYCPWPTLPKKYQPQPWGVL